MTIPGGPSGATPVPPRRPGQPSAAPDPEPPAWFLEHLANPTTALPRPAEWPSPTPAPAPDLPAEPLSLRKRPTPPRDHRRPEPAGRPGPDQPRSSDPERGRAYPSAGRSDPAPYPARADDPGRPRASAIHPPEISRPPTYRPESYPPESNPPGTYRPGSQGDDPRRGQPYPSASARPGSGGPDSARIGPRRSDPGLDDRGGRDRYGPQADERRYPQPDERRYAPAGDAEDPGERAYPATRSGRRPGPGGPSRDERDDDRYDDRRRGRGRADGYGDAPDDDDRYDDRGHDDRRRGEPHRRGQGRDPDHRYDGHRQHDHRYDDHRYDDGRYDDGRYDDDPDGHGRYPKGHGVEQDDGDRFGEDRYATDPALRRRARPVRGAHLPPYQEPLARTPKPAVDPSAAIGGRSPRKLTVTRVAAYRSRELTSRGVQMFRRATTADGADRSGLTHLTYAVMGNYAVDAAMMVGLANTIFFADTGSTGKVLSYLVITVAPFAVVAPFIGPLLDRLERGRRLALALSSFGRALLCLLMALHFNPFNPWVIYPCALGNLVLSKAFSVLKAALTPRVLPEQITLVKTNSRLTVFGLIAGGVAGAVAAGVLKLFGSPGALWFSAACAVGGGVLCLRIPGWVESTEGEVPVRHVTADRRGGFPLPVVIALWANSTIRIETGFLALFMAFVIKNQFPTANHAHSAFTQLLLLGIIGAAAGLGGFVGNALGARLNLSQPELLSIGALAATLLSTVLAAVLPGLATAAIVGLVGSTASSLAKVCLDSVIQHQLPEASRASAFGRSESVLQLAWVFGGVVGLLIGGVWFGHLDAVYLIGFGVVSALLALGLTQCLLRRQGRSMLPRIRGGSGPAGPGSPPPTRRLRAGRRAGAPRRRSPRGTIG